MTLTAGPLLLVSVCYVIAAPAPIRERTHQSPSRSEAVTSAALFHSRCEQAAEALRERAPASWQVVLRTPYLLAGDLTADALETLFVQTILPTAHALQIDYFDRDPDRPITVLCVSDVHSYRTALRLFGHAQREEYAGMFAREEQTVIVNMSTGAGTLAHELTHALAYVDFPAMPEWFDEGLASLHEESEFSADGRHLIGQPNWRLRFLQEADNRDAWRTLDRLFAEPFAEPDRAAFDYALARFFCLYLQEHGLLPAFYRKCRDDISRDATGRTALLRLLPDRSMAEIDAEFRTWLQSRY